MPAVVSCLDALFGPGDSDHAFWLAAVRADILVFVACAALLLVHAARAAPRRRIDWADVAAAAALTGVAALLRFAAAANLSDLGGIGYSRILLGYKGHFATAQLYSLVYAHGARDLEHAILLNRLASTLTVPLVYALCRRLAPSWRALAPITAALLALHPLHVLFTPTDALPISTSFVAAAAYLMLVVAIDSRPPGRIAAALGAAAGLALLTQIRYENLLFLVPALLYVGARRRALRRIDLAAAALFIAFLAVFAFAALQGASTYQNPIRLADTIAAVARSAAGNPIFALVPLLAGTAAAMLHRRSRIRLLAPLPLLIGLGLSALTGSTEGHHQARTFVNELLLIVLVAGYGLALLWDSPRVGRGAAAVCLLWAAALPLLFWPNLRERHLEMAEHDFLRAALAELPAGVDRVIVPDDERLLRETRSTIESSTKYRMIAHAAGARGVELVSLTRFLERPEAVDCSRGNCVFLRGILCMGLRRYWFAEEDCARMMASGVGPALREEEVIAGSFVDCSIHRGAARRRLCEPVRSAQRFGVYRVR